MMKKKDWRESNEKLDFPSTGQQMKALDHTKVVHVCLAQPLKVHFVNKMMLFMESKVNIDTNWTFILICILSCNEKGRELMLYLNTLTEI